MDPSVSNPDIRLLWTWRWHSFLFISPGGLFPWSTSLNEFSLILHKNSNIYEFLDTWTLLHSRLLYLLRSTTLAFHGPTLHTVSFPRAFSHLPSDSDILSALITPPASVKCHFQRSPSRLSRLHQVLLYCFPIRPFVVFITGYKSILNFVIVTFSLFSFIFSSFIEI